MEYKPVMHGHIKPMLKISQVREIANALLPLLGRVEAGPPDDAMDPLEYPVIIQDGDLAYGYHPSEGAFVIWKVE